MPYPIIDELSGRTILVDGRLIDVDEPETGSLFLPQDIVMYYEVIRVVQGIPLFLEDHLRRLERSVSGDFDVSPDLYQESYQLIEANGCKEANLRIVLTRQHRVMHLAPSYYPDAKAIKEGVLTGLLEWERPNPNTKMIHPDYKEAVALRFARPGPYGPLTELILVDRCGHLTEGSRSNLFFIEGHRVISAPDEKILLGITRRYVEKAINEVGLELTFELLTLDDVRARGIQTAFLSGSPIDLLPIRAIEDDQMTSAGDPVFWRLYDAYLHIVQNYIKEHQSNRKHILNDSSEQDVLTVK